MAFGTRFWLEIGALASLVGVCSACADEPTPTEGLPCEAGEVETRSRYKSAFVTNEADCELEEQSRVCFDDEFWQPPEGFAPEDQLPGGWSGTFLEVKCEVPRDCGETPHGETESRTRYGGAFDPNQGEESCDEEEQTRECINGEWSSWDGELTEEECESVEALSCGTSMHGYERVRVRYFEESPDPLNDDATCQQEEQTSSCNNGEWETWSGSFTADMCSVPSCEDGDEVSRERYKSIGGYCHTQHQERTCSNGVWGGWSGSYVDSSCGGLSAPRCESETGGGISAGSSETRLRYATESVAYGETCVSEEQSRLCDNGEWGEWSGSLSLAACSVEDPVDCSAEFAHGAAMQRVRYQSASVPFDGFCVQETQYSTCSNGVQGAWSGTYTAESCEQEPPPTVYCEDSPGLCKQASSSTDALAAWCNSAASSGSCGEFYFGYCTFVDEVHPQGYVEFYYNWDGPMKSATDCSDEGGVYTPSAPL